jgi:response regulator RpfG family c-di-GMP phosphodiesterase
MKTHAQIGGQIFRDLREGLMIFDKDLYKVAEEIACSHHERWDGSGYPQGLKEHEIPLSARIVAVADVFDAITSKRVYKEAFDIEKSLSIIKDSSGSHLDPFVVEVFFENFEKILTIFEKESI